MQDSELKDSARHGSRSVREEALTAAIFCACVDFVRACIHPSSLAAQPPPCTRPPKTAYRVRTLTARSFFAARKPRSQGSHQRQQLPALGRGGLLQQQRRSDLTSAFPTRSGAQFAMPGGSDEGEARTAALAHSLTAPTTATHLRVETAEADFPRMMCLARTAFSNTECAHPRP